MPLFIGKLTGYLFNLELARSLSSAGLLLEILRPHGTPLARRLCGGHGDHRLDRVGLPHSLPVVRPPYHLWFVPVILAFMFGGQACRLGPATMLAIAIPTSIGAMYVFGVGHDVLQFGAWTPDRRYFIYPIYFTLGMWVRASPRADAVEYPLLLVAFVGLLWWSRLFDHPSHPRPRRRPSCSRVLLIFLFVLSAADSLLHRAIGASPATACSSTFGIRWCSVRWPGDFRARHRCASAGTTLAAWTAITPARFVRRVLGVRPAASPAHTAATRMPDAASPEAAA